MNKKSILIIVVLIAGLLLSSCASKDESAMDKNIAYDGALQEAPMAVMEDSDMFYGDYEESTVQTASVDAGEAINYSEKIIYNVNMGITVADPAEAAKLIKEQVSAIGGYVSSSYSYKNDDNSSYVNMQVRVPAKGLTDMTAFIESISEVDYENMYTDNITESYYDTVARLEHEKLQAKQLEEIMEKAETIEDIITVRQELSAVQENIEVYEGRIRMWDSLVDYSTVDIYIQPTPTIDNNNGKVRLITLGETGRAIVRALDNSWRFVANFFSLLLRVIAALLIPAIIVVPIVILSVKAAKKKKARRKEEQDGEEK
ncbi:MAG: DUF4349 domain-containing protein [Clostridia bacterium]|nr:DUF4349 domain-containing protein [Clostridia bacterium]